MSNEDDSDLEIYGTRPGVIAFFMILISVFVAFFLLPMNILLYFTIREGDTSLWFISEILIIAYSPLLLAPLTIPNLAYIWMIVRYYRGDCTRYSAIWIGIFTVTLPTAFLVVAGGFFGSIGSLYGISAMYIPFIAGLILMYKIPGPELISPWHGDFADRSWWKLKRPEWWYRMFPESEEDEAKVSEPESKSERLETE